MTRKKIGLALSGGGARGFAHVGALKALLEHGIQFDMIAGTSAGAIVGGALASGMSMDEIVAMAMRVSYPRMMRPAIAMGGMFTNAPMGAFLSKKYKTTRIEELVIPFAAVAYDLLAGEKVIYKNSGDIIEGIRASCAVPGVFTPIRDSRGKVLLDGGVMSPLPVETAREMGADIIIAIDLISCGATFRSDPRTSVGIMIRSTMTLLREVAKQESKHADVVIEPAIAHLRPDQISKRDEFIALGEEAALEKLPAIQKLIG